MTSINKFKFTFDVENVLLLLLKPMYFKRFGSGMYQVQFESIPEYILTVAVDFMSIKRTKYLKYLYL